MTKQAMTTRVGPSWPVLAMLATAAGLAGGCGMSEFLKMHLSTDRREEAQAHWNNIRGGVKTQMAEEHLKAGRLAEAERALEEALAVSPSAPQVYVLATRLRLEQGRLAEAKQAIRRAAALTSDDAEVPYLRGRIAEHYGELETAAEHYAHALQLAPNNADYLIAEAEALVGLDRPIEALALLEPRTADFEQDAEIQRLAARVSRLIGLRGPAVEHAQAAVRITNSSPMTVAELGEMLSWAERYDEAIDVLSAMLESAKQDSSKDEAAPPTISPASHCLARCYLETKQPGEAMRVLRRVVHRGEASALTWHLSARAALAMGNVDEAAQALAKRGAIGPRDAGELLFSALVSLRRGRADEALATAKQAVALNEQDAVAQCMVGEAAAAAGKTDEAREAYETALMLAPEMPAALNRLDAITTKARGQTR